MISGSTPRTDEDSYWIDGNESAGTPFVAISDMSRRDRVNSTSKKLSLEGLESRAMPIGSPGMILFAMYASVGEVAFLGIEATWNQAILGITPDEEKVDSRFLRYVLLGMRDDLLREVRTNTQDNLNATQVGNIWYWRPPLDEQRSIADYLDRETQKIDELITEQRGLVEILRERRISSIRAQVSGVDQGGVICPSTEWFGLLPEGWKVSPVIFDFDVTLGKMLNSLKTEADASVKAPYLAAGSIQPNDIILNTEKSMSFSLDELERYSLRRGDVVVVEGGAGYGRSHYIAEDMPGWGFQNHVARVRPTSGRVIGRFLNYCLKACLSSGYVEANNRTSTMPSLSQDVLGSIRIPQPPTEMQEIISDRLDEQLSRIDELISESEDLVALSQERRAALITAAVTGQIDVRTEA
jgi:type I restriction enzyme S subunit